MADNDDILNDLLEKMVQVQIDTKQKLSENIAEMKKLQVQLEDTNDVIHANNVFNEGIKGVIKEFSIYASNREDADNHLQDNMKLLSEMWQESLTLFSETKYIIEGIYKYVAIVSEERTRILNNIQSDKYDGLTKYQEWMYDMVIEVVHAMAPEQPTQRTIENWIKFYIGDYKRENTGISLPQYLDVDGRMQFTDDFHEKLRDEFKLTRLVTNFLWAFCIIFQSSELGIQFIDHPKLPHIIKQLKKYEDVIYE